VSDILYADRRMIDSLLRFDLKADIQYMSVDCRVLC
jgi:hypothetical protein